RAFSTTKGPQRPLLFWPAQYKSTARRPTAAACRGPNNRRTPGPARAASRGRAHPNHCFAMATTPSEISPSGPQPIAFKVLTVNVHKGFTSFNRRFMLHELRDAVRSVAADLVFLQEVQGTHHRHASRLANFPQVPHYE